MKFIIARGHWLGWKKKKKGFEDAVFPKQGKNAEREEIQLPVMTSLIICVGLIDKNTKKSVNKPKNRNHTNTITETEFKNSVNRSNRSARAEERISETGW